MALDPQIALMVQPSNIVGAAQQGLQFGQQFAQQRAMAPIQQQAAQAQAAGQAAEAQKLERGNQIAGARLLHDTAAQLRKTPIDQRAAVAQMAVPQLQKLGIDTSQIDLSQHLDDATLDQTVSALAPLIVDPNQDAGGARVVGNETIVNKNGRAYAQSRLFDQKSQKIVNIETDIGPADAITNRLGQTAEDKFSEAIRLKQQQEAIAAQNALNVAAGKSAIELNKEAAMTPILGGQEATKAASKDQIALEGEIIDQGVGAAESLPRLEETLDLLKKIDTGGFSKWSKAVADRFGMDTADESLVQSAFSSNIVQLLQQQKGVQTKSDQELIEKTGPNFDLGSKSNIELLKRVVSRNKILKQRALDTAKKRPEYGTALETLTRDYSYSPENAAPAEKGGPVKVGDYSVKFK